MAGDQEPGLRSFVCRADDPLADVLLVQTGAYPDAAEIGIDYGEILAQATMCIQCRIEPCFLCRTNCLTTQAWAF
jgi:hypothetical protein